MIQQLAKPNTFHCRKLNAKLHKVRMVPKANLGMCIDCSMKLLLLDS